jgi:hypothetical protein
MSMGFYGLRKIENRRSSLGVYGGVGFRTVAEIFENDVLD